MARTATRFDRDGSMATHEGRVCAWDGRLDQREGRTPDAPAALRIYARQGEAGLRDLIGDWSAAIWNPDKSSVVLASDYAGVRPLYYHCDAEGVRWSSSLELLVEWTGIPAWDEEYAARFLSFGHVAGRTPYRGILPVTPGHAVVISAAGVSTERFWRLPVQQEIRLESDGAYEEALRAHFEDAVKARCSDGSVVCAELSGGLDSSSVVCMVHRLLGGKRGLATFSYTHEGCRDERYFEAVEKACGTQGTHLDLADFPFVARGETGGAAPAFWDPRFRELARRVDEMDAGVFLTGQLGDFIMGHLGDDSEQVAEYLYRGQFGAAFTEAFAWSRVLEVPIYSILWRALRTTHLAWTAPLETGIWGGPPSPFNEIESLSPGLKERLDAAERAARKDPWSDASPGRRRRFKLLSEVLERRTLQVPELLQHIFYSHPFAHRPLVEFMLTIPAGQVCRPGETRRLMRRAFAGLLPDAICRRQSKATYGHLYRQALLPLAAEMASRRDNILIVELGFADRTSLLQRLERFAAGLECMENQLRNMILFEFWLRSRQRPSGEERAATPSFAGRSLR